MIYRLGVKHTFAFDAVTLHASYTANLFQTFTLCHFIEDVNLYCGDSKYSFITELLAIGPLLQCYTSVYFIAQYMDEKKGLQMKVLDFQWSNYGVCPFGKSRAI